MLGQQVVARLCQTGLCLLKVCLTAHALLGTQADLVEHPFVILQVIFCQCHHLLAHQHVEIALDRLQRGRFAGIQHRPGTRVDRRFLAAHFAGRGKTVEDVLAQVDGRFAAVQITQMIACRAGAGVIGLLPTGTGGEIQRWQIATFGSAKILICRIAAVHRRVNFRVPEQAVFYGLLKRSGLALRCAQHQRRTHHNLTVLFHFVAFPSYPLIIGQYPPEKIPLDRGKNASCALMFGRNPSSEVNSNHLCCRAESTALCAAADQACSSGFAIRLSSIASLPAS